MKAQMFTTLRGHALDSYMKFYVVPIEILQKTLNRIQAGLIDESRKPKFESWSLWKLNKISNFLRNLFGTLTKDPRP